MGCGVSFCVEERSSVHKIREAVSSGTTDGCLLPNLVLRSHTYSHTFLGQPQVFRNYDRDKSNTLELGEVMHMCRQLGHMSYNEACFVQVGGREG